MRYELIHALLSVTEHSVQIPSDSKQLPGHAVDIKFEICMSVMYTERKKKTD